MQKLEQTLLLVKEETTYGVDPTPDNTNDIMRVSDVTFDPLSNTRVDRNYFTGGKGSNPSLTNNEFAELTCSIEAAGSGTAGTPPAYAVLLKAAGFDETIDTTPGSEKVTYAPTRGANTTTITCYIMMGANRYRMSGCVVNASVSMSNEATPVITFTIRGLFVDVSNQTFPQNNVYTAFHKPVPFNKDNTTVAGLTTEAVSFSFDLGNELQYADFAGRQEFYIGNRTITGSLSKWITDTNTPTTIKNDSPANLEVQHGQTAGNIVKFTFPQTQITAAPISETNDVRTEDWTLAMHSMGAGDNDVSIVIQ